MGSNRLKYHVAIDQETYDLIKAMKTNLEKKIEYTGMRITSNHCVKRAIKIWLEI